MDRKRPQDSKHMIRRARQLRRESSFPERLLWSRLRNGRCAGLKFRRRHPVGPYVADFFCASARLVVELDGRSHDERADYDRRREEYLRQQGLRVLRFPNDLLLHELEAVVEAIAAACPPSPGPAGRPLPEGEGYPGTS
jgi:very-short-patch-repair endonuclease